MVKKLNLSGVVTEHEWFNTILWKFFPELPDQTDDKANKIHQEIMVISSFIYCFIQFKSLKILNASREKKLDLHYFEPFFFVWKKRKNWSKFSYCLMVLMLSNNFEKAENMSVPIKLIVSFSFSFFLKIQKQESNSLIFFWGRWAGKFISWNMFS